MGRQIEDFLRIFLWLKNKQIFLIKTAKKKKKNPPKKRRTGELLVKKLWADADKLRKTMDAAEYKHIVLGLIFLKLLVIVQFLFLFA